MTWAVTTRIDYLSMTSPPYTTCLCAPSAPCVTCPLAHPCSCGATAGQRCRRPSGHRGPFVDRAEQG